MSLGFFPQLNIHAKYFVLHSRILNSVTGVVSHKEDRDGVNSVSDFYIAQYENLLESFSLVYMRVS